MTVHPSTLYVNARCYSAADPRATALLVRDGRVAWLGQRADAPGADVTVDCAGGVLAPAFVDAHQHATDTGLLAEGLDLAGVRSAGEVLDAVAGFVAARPGVSLVHGHGWDESTWPDPVLPSAAQLGAAAGGARVYLTQASVHAAVASPALLSAAGLPADVAVVTEGAHHAVRAVARGSLSAADRVRAQRRALADAAAVGTAAVHECGGPGTSSEADLGSVLALSGDGLPQVFGYWGELGGAERARQLGAVGAAGDLYADGALGSRTAWLSQPYADGAGCGESFVSAEQAAAHVVDCVRVGVQAGFHAIGDAAIAAVLEGFARAARVVGTDRVRRGRHRVEHLELADKAAIARLVEFGVTASVQPAFDAVWGGPDRMYARRLGVARALASNPVGAMHATGVALAFGSDAPVTRRDPWAMVAAAAAPRNPVFRMGVRAAFAAASRGGWRAAGVDDVGVLAPGRSATFAVWEVPGGVDGGLPVVLPDVDGVVPARPVCRRTVLHGVSIFEG